MARQRFRPRIVDETFSAMKEITQVSDGISAAFPFQIANELATNALAVLPVESPLLALNYGLITKQGRTPTPAMECFTRLVLEIEAGFPSA
jgi:DNA-binding transcriptional LysR family regulator